MNWNRINMTTSKTPLDQGVQMGTDVRRLGI